jgi:spore coat polysaccharide biosynthesis protein SpsF (cytidylyltransferase family)
LPFEQSGAQGGKPSCIDLMPEHLNKAGQIEKIVLATSEDPMYLPLVEQVLGQGYGVLRDCRENDWLARFCNATIYYEADAAIRAIGTCQQTDPHPVHEVFADRLKSSVELDPNTLPPTFPIGLGVDISLFHVLEKPLGQSPSRMHTSKLLRLSEFGTGMAG